MHKHDCDTKNTQWCTLHMYILHIFYGLATSSYICTKCVKKQKVHVFSHISSSNLELFLHFFTDFHTHFGHAVSFMLVLYTLQFSAVATAAIIHTVYTVYMQCVHKPTFSFILFYIFCFSLLLRQVINKRILYTSSYLIQNLCCTKVSHQERTTAHQLSM